MLGGRLFASAGAMLVDTQVGNPGDGVAKPGQRGAQVGDLALWVNAASPSFGWTQLGTSHCNLYSKVLGSGDLTLSAVPSQPWGLVIYRDATSAAVRPETGFAKSPAHVGVVAVSSEGFTYPAPATLATPEGAALRFQMINPPTRMLYEVTAPAGLYVDGTPFTPGTGTWDIVELMRT